MTCTIDLVNLKESFATLISKAEPNTLSHFLTWINVKTVEFKTRGPKAFGCFNSDSLITGRLNNVSNGTHQGQIEHVRYYKGHEALKTMLKTASCGEYTQFLSNEACSKPRATVLKVPDINHFLAERVFKLTTRDSTKRDNELIPKSLSLCNVKNNENATHNFPGQNSPQMPLAQSAKCYKKCHKCPMCLKTFKYSSSFRRHMKIHNGVFSHMCPVCSRKFMRKEHFVRHKCSRRPNKPGRKISTHDDRCHAVIACSNIANDDNQNTGIKAKSDSENSKDIQVNPCDSFSSFSNEIHKMDFSFSASICKNTSESRRKSNTPKKIVSANSFETINTSDSEDGNEDHGNSFTGLCATELYHPNESEHIEAFPLSMVTDDQQCIRQDAAIPRCSEISRDSLLKLNTGSYKVQTFEKVEIDLQDVNHTPTNFIKVVKQGNYLKLRSQMKEICGKLCFVCPDCNKIFHRSSNFSRHMRIHRGIYSYVCPACSRGFFRKEHFQKHKCHRKGMSQVWDRKTKIEVDLLGCSQRTSNRIDRNKDSSINKRDFYINVESGDSQFDNDSSSVISFDEKEI